MSHESDDPAWVIFDMDVYVKWKLNKSRCELEHESMPSMQWEGSQVSLLLLSKIPRNCGNIIIMLDAFNFNKIEIVHRKPFVKNHPWSLIHNRFFFYFVSCGSGNDTHPTWESENAANFLNIETIT